MNRYYLAGTGWSQLVDMIHDERVALRGLECLRAGNMLAQNRHAATVREALSYMRDHTDSQEQRDRATAALAKMEADR